MEWHMHKPEGEWGSGKPVTKSKGRNQEVHHNPLEKIFKNQIAIDSKNFFDSFAIYQLGHTIS